MRCPDCDGTGCLTVERDGTPRDAAPCYGCGGTGHAHCCDPAGAGDDVTNTGGETCDQATTAE